MSGKLKDLMILLDKERAKVRKLEQEVQRLKALHVNALVDKYDKEKETNENISGRL